MGLLAGHESSLSLVGAAEEAASKNGGARKSWGGRPRSCKDNLIEALFYRLRNAGPWRDLPERFGPWSTVHYWHNRWAKEGLWARLLDTLARKFKGKVRLVDGTHVKVHQCAANPVGGAAAQAMGKTRGGRNTKIMCLSDAHGCVVALSLVEGQAYEGHHLEPLLSNQPQGCTIVGDKAYDDDGLRGRLRELGHKCCFPGKRNRRQQPVYNRRLYRTRYRVENLFCRLKRFGCIATRRDKLASNYLALVQFGAIIDWLSFHC